MCQTHHAAILTIIRGKLDGPLPSELSDDAAYVSDCLTEYVLIIYLACAVCSCAIYTHF